MTGSQQSDPFEISYLVSGVRESFNEILNMNLAKLNLKEKELEKRKRNRSNLRKALRTCAYGDPGAKQYVKDYEKNILQKKFQINERTIDRSIPFKEEGRLSPRDKFEILLYYYQSVKGYKRDALREMILKNQWDKPKLDRDGEPRYEITKEDVEALYQKEKIELSYLDKLELLSQRVFSMDKGNGVIDELMYQKIDGCSGGCSGLTKDMYSYWESRMGNKGLESKLKFTHDAVWIMFQGKTIHLSFLSFGSENELIRVSKSIYKYDCVGHLSQSLGKIVNTLKSGSRVSVMRPTFGASWSFWIRMFDSVEKKEIEILYPQKGNDKLKAVLKLLVRGEQTCVISGSQGAGKTTLLVSMVSFIRKVYNIRTIEGMFELVLQKIYADRNIAAMRETATVSSEEAVEFSRRTDADVVIFGEVVKKREAEKLIDLKQSGTRFSLSTHHAVNPDSLIAWFRNAFIQISGFSNETIAEEQVVDAIRFDIHCFKRPFGERYVSRITEIVPQTWEKDLPTDPMQALRDYLNFKIKRNSYRKNVILEYRNGEYVMVNAISPHTLRDMIEHMEESEIEELKNLFQLDDSNIYKDDSNLCGEVTQ